MLPRIADFRLPALLAPVLVLGAGLGLAACSSGPDQPPAQQMSGPDTCGVGQLQGHLGELLDVQLLQFFEAAVPSHRVLVMKPDTMATTDNVPERAIIKTDAQSMITSIGCG